MMIHEIGAPQGARKAAKRKGRGAASGNGKTAGYGHKGQKARSGAKKAGFEGGQLPLQRRIPKRGFNNIFAEAAPAVVNLSVLEKHFEDGAAINMATLAEKGLLRKKADKLKILGTGELSKKLEVKAHGFTASAKEKIEKAGGKAEVI